MTLHNYTIQQVETMLRKKEISATELAQQSFDRIKEVDGDVGAFITLNEDAALAKAKALDDAGSFNKKLAAIPGAIKDNITVKGVKLTCASNLLANFEDPLYDAFVTEKLATEDALMIGKLNLDEFAMGSSTETSALQKTRNPWDLNTVPGGSSGGSAAAVAAGEVMFTLGSDTGGSIRQPAAFCGIVGMKPTYGLVSRYGLAAFAPSLDQIGPMTRTVEDNARILEVIAGHDKMDSTSSRKQIPLYTESLVEDVKGLKIAVPKQFLGAGVTDEVRDSIKNALQMFELLGATWEEVSMPHLAYADAAYYIISSGEASSSLARYDGIRFGERAEGMNDLIELYKETRGQGFGDEVKRRILLGSTVLTGDNNDKYFKKAQQIRTLIGNDFKAAFDKYDIIIGPTTPTAAYGFKDESLTEETKLMGDLLTVPANLAGLPALSVPNGYTDSGLPLGMQIIGKHFDEATIYRAAYTYERATNHHKRRPNLGGASE